MPIKTSRSNNFKLWGIAVLHVVVVMMGLMMLAGCGDSKSSASKPPQAAEQQVDDIGPAEADTTPVIDANITNLEIRPTNNSGTTFSFDDGDSISIEFDVTGDNGATVAVALLDPPSGSTLNGASSSNPTFRWSNPSNGTHSFRFILRDMDACEEAEGSLSACRLDDTVDDAEGTYDTISDRYTLQVGIGSSTDISSDNNGSNDSLIGQILQGFGGNGGDLSGLLQGMNTGQLQQILQGQGSGLDLSTLIQLVQGFTLTTEQE